MTSILRKLTEKPWLTPGLDPLADTPDERTQAQSAAKTGLRLYFLVASVMFSLIITVNVLRMGDFGRGSPGADGTPVDLPWWSLAALCRVPPAHDWAPLPEPPLLWINTGILLLSSIAWQMARHAAHRGQIQKMRIGLMTGGALALVFLAGQLLVWRELDAAGYFLTTSPANAFFYLITALHGLHLVGGLVVWGQTTSRALQGATLEAVTLRVDLCTIYWHFLLLVWLVMFALLLTT